MATHRGSLRYQVKQQFEAECSKPSKKRGRMTPITPQSEKQYQGHVEKFQQWCKERHHCRNVEDCAGYIQPYADLLVQRGLSASTIHTYLAAICRTWGVPMDKIKKPIRHTAQNTRSRGAKAADRRSDTKQGASPRLYDFAAKLGIRRAEYGKLRGDDLIQDESGCWCVRVKKGKGGKFQLQRILPKDVAFVRSYFDGDPDRNIFTKGEMKNKIDLHHLRAQVAQRAYNYYIHRLEQEPAYREKLTAEIKARWQKYCGKPWRMDEITGWYYVRGQNRELARRHNLPLSWDRLALMAVSVFHLSHWRLDVTVNNYMLAV